jgi:predicted  nucleic acid-binding Zn-ribbon protein
MKFDATADEIRALLRYVELNAAAEETASGSRRGRVTSEHGIPPPLLERYGTLREKGRSPEVVAIDRGACSGCHVKLPTMLEYRAGRRLALYTCPHCRRLLYSPELLGGGQVPEAPRKPERRSRSAPRT